MPEYFVGYLVRMIDDNGVANVFEKREFVNWRMR